MISHTAGPKADSPLDSAMVRNKDNSCVALTWAWAPQRTGVTIGILRKALSDTRLLHLVHTWNCGSIFSAQHADVSPKPGSQVITVESPQQVVRRLFQPGGGERGCPANWRLHLCTTACFSNEPSVPYQCWKSTRQPIVAAGGDPRHLGVTCLFI